MCIRDSTGGQLDRPGGGPEGGRPEHRGGAERPDDSDEDRDERSSRPGREPGRPRRHQG